MHAYLEMELVIGELVPLKKKIVSPPNLLEWEEQDTHV
jgi:hypothetical protein